MHAEWHDAEIFIEAQIHRLRSILTDITLYFSEAACRPPLHIKMDWVHTQCYCYFMSIEYRLYNASNNREETCYSCESVQSPDPQQIRSDQTLQTGKLNPYVPTETEEVQRRKAREQEEPQSVKHNLITPICHDLHLELRFITPNDAQTKSSIMYVMHAIRFAYWLVITVIINSDETYCYDRACNCNNYQHHFLF